MTAAKGVDVEESKSLLSLNELEARDLSYIAGSGRA